MEKIECKHPRKNDTDKQCGAFLGLAGEFTVSNYFCKTCKAVTKVRRMNFTSQDDIFEYIQAIKKLDSEDTTE